MKISVVIPAYNAATFIGDAIKSVREQTYTPHEIIVVDDGSADGTAAAVSVLGADIRYIPQRNGGVSSACNRGVLEASGEVIAFLDADDWWHPQKLERQAAALKTLPEIALAFTRTDWLDERWGARGSTFLTTAPTTHDILAMKIFPRSSVAVRTEAFRAVGGFDESLASAEDWDLWMRLAMRYSMRGLDESLATTRIHGANLSRATDRMRDVCLAVLERYRFMHGPDCLECRTISGNTERYIRDDWYLSVRNSAKEELRVGRYISSLRLNIRAVSGNPRVLWNMPFHLLRRMVKGNA